MSLNFISFVSSVYYCLCFFILFNSFILSILKFSVTLFVVSFIDSLSSGNASKDKFLTGKKNLPAATFNLCEYSRLRSELKKQTDIVEKQYQGWKKLFKSDGKEEIVKILKKVPLTIKKRIINNWQTKTNV